MQQKGRSMVEMLGVLAIIGVLSAGGLAGYHQAVAKHRLNVWGEQVQQTLMNLYELCKGDSECNSSNNISLKNIVPEGFLKKPYNNRLGYDIYGNSWQMNPLGFSLRLGGTQYQQNENVISFTCPKLLEILKESRIYQIRIWSRLGAIYINSTSNCNVYTCLSFDDLTKDKLLKICESLTSEDNEENDTIWYFYFN